MGKAFSEIEKETIRTKLLETGVEMFHDNSVKAISVRELTKRVGISQGGFYTFYDDKDKFVIDVMSYRAKQKLEKLETYFDKSLENPSEFLSQVMFDGLIDMKHKTDTRKLYSDVFRLFMKDPQNAHYGVQVMFRGFIEKLNDFWNKNNTDVTADINGICSVMTGAFLLFYHSDMIDSTYFDNIFRTYIYSNI